MSAVTTAVNITGTADAEDKIGLLFAIERENQRRAALGLSMLPSSTGPERKASAEIAYGHIVAELLASDIAQGLQVIGMANDPLFKQVKTLWPDATVQKRNSAITALQ